MRKSAVFVMLGAMAHLCVVGDLSARGPRGGGGRGAMSFGKSRARLLTEKQGRVTFDDVAGVDEAKEELEEIWPDLELMERTKVGQGFALLEKNMTKKQRRNYLETEERTEAARRAVAPAARAA